MIWSSRKRRKPRTQSATRRRRTQVNRKLSVLCISKNGFGRLIRSGSQSNVRSLDGAKTVDVFVVPMEDLIVSKLWPTFEPNTVHDLLLLLACDEALRLDADYMRRRMESSGGLKMLCYQSYQYFESIYRRTTWYQLTHEKANTERVSKLLKETLFPLLVSK